MTELSHQELLRLLRYEPETGKFFWVKNGREAGGFRGDAKWKIKVGDKRYFRSRLAWFYMTGEWPIEADHRDLDVSNDRWGNLRNATHSQNMGNTRLRKTNTTGAKGVVRSGKKYMAKLRVHNQYKYLGTFDSVDAAAAAYRAAAVEHFGEFFRAS